MIERPIVPIPGFGQLQLLATEGTQATFVVSIRLHREAGITMVRADGAVKDTFIDGVAAFGYDPYQEGCPRIYAAGIHFDEIKTVDSIVAHDMPRIAEEFRENFARRFAFEQMMGRAQTHEDMPLTPERAIC